MWAGQGNRGPRHLASRHVCHFQFQEFLHKNSDSEELLRRKLDEFAGQAGALEKLRALYNKGGEPSSRKGVVGGNPKFTFINHWEHNAKLLNCSMDADMLASERARAVTVWERDFKHNREQYLQWYWEFRRQLEERRLNKVLAIVEEDDQPESAEEEDFVSPWGSGSGFLPTCAETLQVDLTQSSQSGDVALRTNPRCIEARDENQYLVKDAEASAVELLRIDPDDIGCLQRTHNVCMTINALRLPQIDAWFSHA